MRTKYLRPNPNALSESPVNQTFAHAGMNTAANGAKFPKKT